MTIFFLLCIAAIYWYTTMSNSLLQLPPPLISSRVPLGVPSQHPWSKEGTVQLCGDNSLSNAPVYENIRLWRNDGGRWSITCSYIFRSGGIQCWRSISHQSKFFSPRRPFQPVITAFRVSSIKYFRPLKALVYYCEELSGARVAD